MARCGLICLLLLSAAWGQGNTVPSSPAPDQAIAKSPAAPGTGQDFGFPADKVPQDAPIITVTGLCDRPSSAKSTTPECKTVITRAEFEKILDVLNKPHAPQAGRRLIALSHVQAQVKAQKALEMGLDKSPDFANRMEVNRLLVTQETWEEAVNRQEWEKVSDKQIEDYYRQNPAEFVQVDAERVFVPWFEPDDDPNKKLTGEEKRKRDLDWKHALKDEADKLHARALAGEDFLVLQKEAYKFTGVSPDVDRSSITLPRTRRLMLDAALMPLMDLQPGQVSPVLPEDNGYYMFKATKRVTMPFDDLVKRELHAKFRDEYVKADKAAIEQLETASTTYNDNYFGPPPPPASKTPGYDVMPDENQP